MVTDRFGKIANATGLWVVTGLAERGKQVAVQSPTLEAYDSAVMINPAGTIVLHHRQSNVLKNAFSSCPDAFKAGCGYTPGPLSEIKVAATPFGVVVGDPFPDAQADQDACGAFHLLGDPDRGLMERRGAQSLDARADHVSALGDIAD